MSAQKYGIGVPSLAQKMFKELNVHPPFPQLSFFPFVQPTIDILRSLEIPFRDEVLLIHDDFTVQDVGKTFSTGIIVPDGYVLIVNSLEVLYHDGGDVLADTPGFYFSKYIFDQYGDVLFTSNTNIISANKQIPKVIFLDDYGRILFPGTELLLTLISFTEDLSLHHNGYVIRVTGRLQFVGGLIDEIQTYN